ncbi:DUF6435 family protein [Rhodoflexus sp.]
MFGLFSKKNTPEKEIARLTKLYAQLSEEAMQLQRKGDIKSFAVKTAEAEEIMKKIEALKQSGS